MDRKSNASADADASAQRFGTEQIQPRVGELPGRRATRVKNLARRPCLRSLVVPFEESTGIFDMASERNRLQADRIPWRRGFPMATNGDIDIAAEPRQQTHQAFDGHIPELPIEQA